MRPLSMARSPPTLTSSGITGYPYAAFTNRPLRPGTSAGREYSQVGVTDGVVEC